eukprot:3277446-Pleurochrysis_carterae.AAC.1
MNVKTREAPASRRQVWTTHVAWARLGKAQFCVCAQYEARLQTEAWPLDGAGGKRVQTADVGGEAGAHWIMYVSASSTAAQFQICARNLNASPALPASRRSIRPCRSGCRCSLG